LAKNDSRIIGVIPARYDSSRFPGKPLVRLLDKPMILWVSELSSKALGKQNVYVATDDHRIKETVEEAGFQVVMTSKKHLTGTDRLAEVAELIEADVYVNIQGDEPTLNPKMIDSVLREKKKNPQFVINAMVKIGQKEDPSNRNIPKVTFNESNLLVYMSRLPVPGFKAEKDAPVNYYKQVCIYAFSREQLIKYGDKGRKSYLESCEDIEILRYLDLGIQVKMVEIEEDTFAVDEEKDILRVENRLKEIHGL
jgi:3-deoxy-manno-octulosonate cytidylyltransferase (CMP-KDO synthetase)